MSISKKHRGRPRIHRPQIDKGTKELQQKRELLLGRGGGQNPAMAESLLGILYARQLISRPLYEAGRFFGELGYRYEPCLGHKFRQNSSSLFSKKRDIQGSSPFQWSDKQDEKRTLAWNNALKALKQAGGKPYKTVLKVVFYNQDLYSIPFPRFIAASVVSLRKGLESLEDYFKEGLKGKQGKYRDLGLNPARSTRFQPTVKEYQSSFPP